MMPDSVLVWGVTVTVEVRSDAAGLVNFRIPTGSRTTRICLWGPNVDGPTPRDHFIADVCLNGACFEAAGPSAQEAIDGLLRILPAPPSRGGVA